MKRSVLALAMGLIAITAMAKTIKTTVFTTSPQMHCENCENKIKGNLRFEKGVKKIVTDIDSQINSYDTNRQTNLRSSQTHTICTIHGFKHICYQLFQIRVIRGNILCFFTQHRLSIHINR